MQAPSSNISTRILAGSVLPTGRSATVSISASTSCALESVSALQISDATRRQIDQTLATRTVAALLAVPFFLLTASLMNIGGVTDRPVYLSRTMVGRWPG